MKRDDNKIAPVIFLLVPERENCNVQLGPAHIFPFLPSGQIVSVVASGVQRG